MTSSPPPPPPPPLVAQQPPPPINWLNREQRIHETVFDTLSRPLSRLTTSERMGIFSGARRSAVRLNHYGKKVDIRMSDADWQANDLFEVLQRRIREVIPDFNGSLAYIDATGRQSIIQDDLGVREALRVHQNGRLKLHTTVPQLAVISAAELAGRQHQQRTGTTPRRPTRAHSVPPPFDRFDASDAERDPNRYHHYPPSHLQSHDFRSPSSADSAPAALSRQGYAPSSFSPRPQSGMSPPPPSTQPNSRNQVLLHPAASPTPSEWHYSYAAHRNYYGAYTNPLLYGMPPSNALLWKLFGSPYPLGSPFRQHCSWVGPNKYHNWSGWGGGPYYGHKVGWGPVW